MRARSRSDKKDHRVDILDAAEEILLSKKIHYHASTYGDEWAGPCPSCGGKDRCQYWPNHPDTGHKGGSYWCRQCNESGDAIQLLMNYADMNYTDACDFLELENTRSSGRSRLPRARQPWSPKEEKSPDQLWQEDGGKFVESSHRRLDERARRFFASRGLNEESLAKYKLGMNLTARYFDREDWGLEPEYDPRKYVGEPGFIKPLPIPAGLVIPNIRKGETIGIKIRRLGSKGSKYHNVPGSSSSPVILTDDTTTDLPVMVVETVLDALLIDQEAGDLVVPIALNAASTKPDRRAHDLIENSPSVLISLDFDEAGKKATQWWLKTFHHARPAPIPEGKDPGEYYSLGGNIRFWVKACLPTGTFKVPDKVQTEFRTKSGPGLKEIGCRFGYCRHVNHENGMYCEFAENHVGYLTACPLGKTIKENN